MIFPVLNQFGPFLIHRKSQKKYSSVCIRFECHCMHRMLRGLCKSLYVFKGLFLLSMFKADVATTYPLHWWNWQQFCKHIKWIPLDGLWPPFKHLLLLNFSLSRPTGRHAVKANGPQCLVEKSCLLSHSLQAAETQKIQIDCTAKSLTQGRAKCWKGRLLRWVWL